MPNQQTLSIIKPDAVAKNSIGAINVLIEKAGLRIVAAKMKRLTKEEAEHFYAVHRSRPFFDSLVEFMTSGPVLIQVLEAENAVLSYRQIMGATDPQQAEKLSIRAQFAENIERNAVHGSDSVETAVLEISFFFKPNEIYSR